jgi:hypothetical protein
VPLTHTILDEVTADIMSVVDNMKNALTVDEMTVDEMTVDKLNVDELTVGKYL